MSKKTCYTLHPFEQTLQDEFRYGNMHVKRRLLDKSSKQGKRMLAIFESYLRTGIFPDGTGLIGDYLEHSLMRGDGKEHGSAGHYLGLILPNGNYQYVRLEGESIGVEKHRLHQPEEIVILTDTCLFCASNATATMTKGEVVSIVAPRTKINSHVRELKISERMCFYEMDAVARLTDLIGPMIEGNPAYKKVVIAMPTVEYYFYLMDAYNRGFVEKGLMLQWIAKVNRHAESIVGAIRKRVRVDIEMCQPLESVADYIKECIDKGIAADFEKVKSMLSQGERLWREVLLLTNPKNWKELNYTNYAVAVLETALPEGDGDRLTIDIENPSEQRILRNAAKIARKLEKQGSPDRFRVLGIYPHEKVFIPSGGECYRDFPRLYYLEPDQLDGACYYREILKANRRQMRR